MSKITILFLISSTIIFYSCSSKNNGLNNIKAKGEVVYGGEFRFMSSEKINNLFPLATTNIYNQRVNSQIFESLLRLDSERNTVVPNIAQKIEISPDAKVVTLTIREGVFFHDDECFSGAKGRELTAKDVKYSLDFACSGLKINEISWILIDKIVGAREYNEKTKKSLSESGVSGIRVKDNKVIIQLTQPFVCFDKVLTHASLAIFPREAYEMYKDNIIQHPIGTGAFKLESYTNKEVLLTRNDNYWKKDHLGNPLPFLEKLVITYSINKKNELVAFRNKKIDLVIGIPASDVDYILGSLQDAQKGLTVKHKMDSKKTLSIIYIGFSNNSKPFDNLKVRKAFDLAINRKNIVENYLKGEGYPCENGFVPEIEGYQYNLVKRVHPDVVLARKLLDEAGYPNGKGFPNLDLYVNTKSDNIDYALFKGVKDELKKNLNVNINLKLCSINEKDKAIKSGKAKIWKGGWIADYPDPENFLNLFSSEHIGSNSSIMNPVNYKSTEYDRLLKDSYKERRLSERNEIFVKCDQMLMDEAVIIPLVNNDFITMINSRVKNFNSNYMEMIDFSNVYIKKR